MKLPTVPFNALAFELPGLASVFANQNRRKTAEKKF